MRIVRFIVFQLVLVVLVTTAALFAAEFVARKKFPALVSSPERQERAEGLFIQFDPRLGWSNIPGADVRYERLDFDTRVVINADGFRGASVPGSKAAGTTRIVVLGDSYVFGHGVEVEETFAARLDEALPQTEVVNLGVVGYSTDQQLLQLQDRGLAYEPDLVILCLYRNDVLDNGRRTAWGLYRKPRFLLEEDGRLRLEEETLDEGIGWPMALGRELRRRFVLYDVLSWRFATLRAESVNPDDAGRITRALLSEVADTCARNGVPFLLVTLPGLAEPELVADLPPASLGWRLDLEAIFEEYSQANPEVNLGFEHDSHWNPQGHQLVADAILESIRASGWSVPRSSD